MPTSPWQGVDSRTSGTSQQRRTMEDHRLAVTMTGLMARGALVGELIENLQRYQLVKLNINQLEVEYEVVSFM